MGPAGAATLPRRAVPGLLVPLLALALLATVPRAVGLVGRGGRGRLLLPRPDRLLLPPPDRLLLPRPAGPLRAFAHDDVTYRVRHGSVLRIPQAERYSTEDWLHNLRTMPTSHLLQRLANVMTFYTIWSALLYAAHTIFQFTTPGGAAHGIVGGALGLLLVFRTNSAYDRFWEGRQLWETILNCTRDATRLLCINSDQMSGKRLQRCLKLLCVFPLLLADHLQATQQHSPEQLRKYLRAKELKQLKMVANRPLFVLNKLAQEIRRIPEKESFSSRERMALLSHVHELSTCVGSCERLASTPVPRSYTTHTKRFLALWSLTLPAAMVGQLGIYVVPFMVLTTWSLHGILELGEIIEMPFRRSLRLEVFARTIKRDITDMLHVSDIVSAEVEVESEALEYSPPFHQLLKQRPVVAGAAVAALEAREADHDTAT